MIKILEQSELNGAVYHTVEQEEGGRNKLASKSVAINTIKFGPPTQVIIHRNQTDNVLVEIPNTGEYYLYEDEKYVKSLDLNPVALVEDETFEYLYGVAMVGNQKTPYLIKNKPPVTLTDKPEFQTFKLPPILSGYPYKQSFTYSEGLIGLLGDLPATFTDRYKRPLNPSAIDYRKYFPTRIDKVTTTFSQLAYRELNYPLVVMLASETEFACIDLEPGYSDEDLELANSFDAYYVEDTPRGGKHYLVKIQKDLDVYKYDITEHLEVQINSQITFYGINGKLLNPNPEVSDFTGYKEVGTKRDSIIISDMPDNVYQIVEDLIEINDKLGNTGRIQAKRVYITDKDESHADFTALARLYRIDIKPFIETIPEESLPWVLAEYAVNVIPARVKHSDDRNGVPYLVYLASKITQRRTP